MADIVFGIYGFDFSKPAKVGRVDLVPLFRYPECNQRAEDKTRLLLTGYGRFAAPASPQEDANLVRWLADGMTFCQQQLVIPTRPFEISPGDSIEEIIRSGRFPDTLPTLGDRYTSGEAIGNDTFFSHSRIQFLELFLSHVESSPPDHPVRAATYRQIEMWRLSRPYVEIEHYLAFSGLEILARAYGPHPASQSVAVRLSGYLRSHGFDVPQTLAEDWAAARNALFHRGELQTVAPGSGNLVRIIDHLFPLGQLLCDAALKQLRFDDGHINWNRWQDRQPFC